MDLYAKGSEPGGIILAEELAKLRQTLQDYFGQGNEIAMGIKPKAEEIVEKPLALTRYEQIHELHVPYTNGGLVDQPYLWIQQHGVIKNFLEEWSVIQAALSNVNQGQPDALRSPAANP